jgi:hypothetical protein
MRAGLYPAPLAGKQYGYIDKTRYGYIDTAGKTIAQPVYESAAPFSGGLGLVDSRMDGVHRWVYLDSGGNVVWESE